MISMTTKRPRAAPVSVAVNVEQRAAARPKLRPLAAASASWQPSRPAVGDAVTRVRVAVSARRRAAKRVEARLAEAPSVAAAQAAVAAAVVAASATAVVDAEAVV